MLIGDVHSTVRGQIEKNDFGIVKISVSFQCHKVTNVFSVGHTLCDQWFLSFK